MLLFIWQVKMRFEGCKGYIVDSWGVCITCDLGNPLWVSKCILRYVAKWRKLKSKHILEICHKAKGPPRQSIRILSLLVLWVFNKNDLIPHLKSSSKQYSPDNSGNSQGKKWLLYSSLAYIFTIWKFNLK